MLPRGQIFYDATCGLCTASYRRFGPMTERRGFKWIPLQEPRARELLNLAENEVPPEMKLFTRKGRLLGGAEAVAFVCKYIWWARPVWILSKVPGVMPVFRALYRAIAARRHQFAGTCEYRPNDPPINRAA
jgi:predicted DCC family thiol-disulfide oxidoreductase YuxK